GPGGLPDWQSLLQSGRCNSPYQDGTGRTTDLIRPVSMLQGITRQTGAVSLLIRRLQVRVLRGAPNLQVRGLGPLSSRRCRSAWSFFAVYSGNDGRCVEELVGDRAAHALTGLRLASWLWGAAGNS